MMQITSEQLDLLPREELLVLLKKFLVEMDSLRQSVAELEDENQKLKRQLNKSTNSRNSSQPPSRDQKPNQPQDKAAKKQGPPFGHQKFSRPLVAKPDRVIQVPVTECEHCHADLSSVAPDDFEQRQMTELPPARPIVNIFWGLGAGFGLAGGGQGSDNKTSPLTVQDDAGRHCMPSEIGKVFLWNKPTGIPLVETPYTFIQTPDRAVGYFAATTPFSFDVGTIGVEFYLGTITASITANIGLIGIGEIQDNMILMTDKSYQKSKPYFACPETMAALEKSINDNRVGTYSVTNIGGLNCAGWACKMLKNAGFTPPAPYWLPTLSPADLVNPTAARAGWRISGLKNR